MGYIGHSQRLKVKRYFVATIPSKDGDFESPGARSHIFHAYNKKTAQRVYSGNGFRFDGRLVKQLKN